MLIRFLKQLASAGLVASAIAAMAARAEVIDFKLEKYAANTEFVYGGSVQLRAVLRTRAPQCQSRIWPPGTFTALVDGLPEPVYLWEWNNSCSGDIHTAVGHISTERMDLGLHTFSASYSGADGFALAQAEIVVEVVPEYRGGVLAGVIGLGIDWRWSSSICPSELRQVEFSTIAPESRLPSPLQFRHGVFSFKMKCGPNCFGFSPCPFGAATHYHPGAGMQLQLPVDLPPGSSVWALVPSMGLSWQRLSAQIQGRTAKFEVQDVPIPLTQSLIHIMEGWVGVATPVESAPAAPKVQDIWWGGPGEDGWGLSVAQAGDQLFVTLHAYDDSGQPAFYVLRDGYWDAERKTYGGTLYRPNARSMGGPLGSLHLLFADPDRPLLKYVLASGEGLKPIERMAFGPATSQGDPQAGIWDLTLTGTGAMTIHKRGDSLFMTWLEFPGNGPGQWMVAPSGRWTSADTYESTLYRTTASGWAGGYDSSRLRAQVVGSLKVRFTGTDDGEVTYTIDGVTQASPLRRHGF